MAYVFKKLPAFALTLILTLIAAAEASAQANIVILNGDAAGVGFNDTTPATPVGGNTGITVGQQRLNAFQAAASIWGATLVSSPTITIRGTWEALACSANSGTLGSAGNSGSIWRNFAGAQPGFWYGNALANAISGTDRNGATHEINARFNVSLGKPGCLETAHWYYGLDNNHGATGIDLISVLLHEFAHGLGFQTYTSTSTGQQAGSQPGGFFPSIYDRYLFDSTAGKTWAQMTSNTERVASAINTGHLTWIGPQVLNDVPTILSGTPRLRINSPGAIAGQYQIGTANFGPTLSPSGTTANVVQALDAADGSGPGTTDGCSAFTNPLTVVGKFALIDRGTCTFIVKTRNAQNAGAIGVIIADNDPANVPPPGLGGGPDNTIMIPAVRITQADGNRIKAQLASGVNGTLLSDTSVLAGTDSARRPLMFAPNPVAAGSSVSHWDESLLPAQLMLPDISAELFHSVTAPRDLTTSLFKDIGWPTSAANAPTIVLEQGTTIAGVLDSVTLVRGPFTVLTPHNLGGDGRRRLILFTNDLGLAAGNTTGLTVQANGIPLPVENAGPAPAINGSYIIVRLPNLLPSTYAVTVTFNNVNSTNAPTIQIIP